MAQAYIGEIRMFAGNFAPVDWAFCNGQVLAISDNDALFNLIGTTYGGDGLTTFALPNLQSRVPIHQGGGTVLAQTGGTETVTLTGAQMPVHNHLLQATSNGSVLAPAANALPATVVSAQQGTTLYGTGSGKPVTLQAGTIGANTAGQPHSNIQPYVALSYIIALYGIYPSPG